MAKKAAKKEAVAAKAKKAEAPKAKAPAKASKVLKAAPTAKKAEVKSVAKDGKPVAKKVFEKVVLAEKKISSAKPIKAEKVDKKPKAETKSIEAQVVPEAPKKEKKVKLDKTGLSEDQVKWHEMHEKYKGVKAPLYTISAQFEAKTPIQHKIFGWGYVLSNEYDRLEVIFEDGKRMLISNRKLS